MLHKLDTAPQAGGTRDDVVEAIRNDDILGLVESMEGEGREHDRG
jgi:hypothetical protein